MLRRNLFHTVKGSMGSHLASFYTSLQYMIPLSFLCELLATKMCVHLLGHPV
jgi:hypothetical protein